MFKQCPTCAEFKPLADFNSQGKYCKPCHAERGRRWRADNPDKQARSQAAYRAKPKRKASTREQAISRRDYIVSVKKRSACAHCGENDYVCLHFHHTRDDKEFDVAQGPRLGLSIGRIQAEIDKCIVLCANCHLKEHHRLRQLELQTRGERQ